MGELISDRFYNIARNLSGQTNPRLDPAGYASALRAVNPELEHEAVMRGLQQLALAIEAEPVPAPRAAAVQAPVNQLAEDFDFGETVLARSDALSQEFGDNVAAHFRDIVVRYANEVNPQANPIEFANRLRVVEPIGAFGGAISLTLQRLASEVEAAATPAPRQPRGADLDNQRNDNRAPERVAADMRDTAEEIANLLEESYYTETPNARAAVRLIRQHLRALRRNGEMAFEDILGMATTGYEWSPELLTALEVELESLIERYQGMDDYANGGPVQGYQAGGTVKKPDVPTPYLFSVPTYSETVAYEMYPGQKGQDDQRDAARHMLAAGTLSRKYGPKTAEFLGKAHEFTTSPLQAVKSMFGGQMPADYGMDTHNNRFGAELGQRAKSQAELEDLVQAEAERASRTQTQGQAFIKKANGGIVQENPTTDQMRYALTMRRK